MRREDHHRFDLTPKEQECAALVGRGLSNREIAQCMGLSVMTIKQKLLRVYDKTGCANRVRLARWVWDRDSDSDHK